jgi:hypothetical protein
VEKDIHLGRQARRLLGSTGSVAKNLPSLKKESEVAIGRLWDSMRDQQVVVWLDNWYRKRFGSDPDHNDMSLNVSAMAVLHIIDIPVFPGYMNLETVVRGISGQVARLVAAVPRVQSGVDTVMNEDIQREWIRVPLDVQRSEMRSLQWLPYLLTEETVGTQVDLLAILDGLQVLNNQTKRAVPLLVDMDIHYRILKLIYGGGLVKFDYARNLRLTPIIYGVCHGY